MAKKKSKSKAQPNYMGWVIAAVIVIVIIILVMRTQEPDVAPTDQVTTEDGKVAKVQTAPGTETCDINYAVGKKGPCTLVGSDATVPIKNSGKGIIPGMWFEATTADGKSAFFKSTESVGVGEIKDYTLELQSWGSDLGSSVKSVIVYPMTSSGAACKNQQIGLQVSACI
ncbi:hypothetical protein ACFLZ7_04175 [Nanoarchaeota archaeon]